MKPQAKFRFPGRSQRGFTLVEAVMVIVIVGVIGGMLAVFIQAPVQSYADSLARAELTDTADLALRRMARDLRLALPNSIRVNPAGTAIEMLLTRTGGRYLAVEDGIDTLPVLDFMEANTSFTVVGAMPGADRLTPNRDYLVVNNLGPDFQPANAYDLASPQRNIALVTGIDGNLLTLKDNPFATQSPPLPSPSRRFQIVSGPVTYSCAVEPDGTTRLLTRQSGYTIASVQLDDPVGATGLGQRSLLAGRVKGCSFAYQSLAGQGADPAAARQRSALVILALELQPRVPPRNSTDATVRLVHQVHIDNTP
jgi:MSHA biogenesis protein MshO